MTFSVNHNFNLIFYPCIALPSADNADSLTASPTVGCAWIVFIMSSMPAFMLIASAPSAIRSVALGPTICIPSIFFERLCAIILQSLLRRSL